MQSKIGSIFKSKVNESGPTLCPLVWLPYVPESLEKSLEEIHEAFVYKQMPKSRSLCYFSSRRGQDLHFQ